MPNVTITVGGREYSVACEPGQEAFLRSAANLLDGEASQMATGNGRMPESQMLLMAGLMIADRTVSGEERLRLAEEKIAAREARIAELENRPLPMPERVEVPVETVVEVEKDVPVVPPDIILRIRKIADTAETLIPRRD